MDRSTGAGGDGITTTGGTGQWFQQMLEGEEEAVDKIQSGLEGGHGPSGGNVRRDESEHQTGSRRRKQGTVRDVLCTWWVPVTQSSGG